MGGNINKEPALLLKWMVVKNIKVSMPGRGHKLNFPKDGTESILLILIVLSGGGDNTTEQVPY